MKRVFLRVLRPAVTAAALLVALVAMACGDADLSQRDATLLAPPNVPAALPRTQAHVKVHLVAKEIKSEIAPGVNYTLWTFNDTVPGPLIRVHEGDTVEIILRNDGSSTVTHNIDLHSVNGPGGGAEATNVAPGETRSFLFLAKSAGLFTYHCAAGLVADHIANGMYGGILVEPAGGLPKVDREFYVGQSDMYTDLPSGEKGDASLDLQKLLDENPTYVVFNGNTKSLIGDKALQAKTGETVRIYFVQGGPNQTSSFHIIGEIFDKAWAWGTLESRPIEGVQTISVPPGGATIVEFKVDVPGDYKLVDHALGRVAKGAAGTLHVTGPEDKKVFASTDGLPVAGGGHDMGTGGDSEPSGTEVKDGETLKVTMKDNTFTPKAIIASAGSLVKFDVPNAGKVAHNLRIAQLDGNFDGPGSVVTTPEIVMPGKSGALEWKVPAETGTYKFRCDLHPVDMTGTIVVK